MKTPEEVKATLYVSSSAKEVLESSTEPCQIILLAGRGE
jgi:hypothetical protein